MKSRANAQLNLPPSLLPKREHSDALLPKQEQQQQPSITECDAVAAQLFDEALTASGLSSQEVAYLLGVSESLVRKMRSVNCRENVSFTQLLKLPPSFHLALHRSMNRRFGFGRQLLARLLDDIGDLALAVER